MPALNSTEYDGSVDIVAGGASDHHSDVIVMLTYVFYALMLAAVVQFLVKRLPTCIRPPYAMTLFTLGALLSYLHHTQPPTGWELFSKSIRVVENINPEVVFFVILPPLLYESGSGLNWHVFRRLMWSAMTLAFPGVVLNLFFIGIFVWVSFGEGWTLPLSFLVGSMLSTTDPVAVVAALHNLNAPDKLALLIDGESLLNDGSAIVGVLIFQNMIETGEFSFLSILDLLFRCAGGGCLFGILSAGLIVLMLKMVNKFDHSAPALEVAIVVVGIYLCYLVGDLLHMSGIIAVVSLAISMAVIGRGAFSPEGEHACHTVVSQLAYFANQLIWLAGGHMTAAQLSQSDVATDPVNWIRMVSLFLVLNIARGLSTWIMFPTLTRMGYGLNLKETIVLIYAGLRGGVCIALVLLIRRSSFIPTDILNEMGFFVAGSVMLTLMVNGMTIERLYRWLEIYPKRTWAQVQLQRALSQVDDREKRYVEALKQHWFFKELNLQSLMRIMPQFGRAEFNVHTGEVHVPLEKVSDVMLAISDRFDLVGVRTDSPDLAAGGDNGFLYSALNLGKGISRSDSSSDLEKIQKKSDLKNEKTDRLVNLVQLGESRLKAVQPSRGPKGKEMLVSLIGKKQEQGTIPCLFQSNRSIADFEKNFIDQTGNPFASFERTGDRIAGGSMEFSVTIPDTHIDKELMGVAPRLVIGLSAWNSDSSPGDCEKSCGLCTETKAIRVNGSVLNSDTYISEFRREFVRGDTVTVTVELAGELGIRASFTCGRYLVGSCVIDDVKVTDLFPTVSFLAPEEQAELSFSVRTTTRAETRAESYAYILNAAICLYDDLFRGGSLSAESLRVLCDSVEYGIDAANDDLEVRSMRARVKTVRDIYTRGKSRYEAMPESEETELSPLDTEWGFLQLRHMSRVDCNHEGFLGWLIRFGELLGFRTQYRQTYRKTEELLAYGVVHSDLVAHVEMARFPETLELVARLVTESRRYLLDDVRRSSPRDFYIAQHVLAAKILLNIRRKVLHGFTKDGSLSNHAVEEIDEHYIKKQLLALDDYTPRRPKGSSFLSQLTRLPRSPAAPVELKRIVTMQK